MSSLCIKYGHHNSINRLDKPSRVDNLEILATVGSRQINQKKKRKNKQHRKPIGCVTEIPLKPSE